MTFAMPPPHPGEQRFPPLCGVVNSITASPERLGMYVSGGSPRMNYQNRLTFRLAERMRAVSVVIVVAGVLRSSDLSWGATSPQCNLAHGPSVKQCQF